MQNLLCLCMQVSMREPSYERECVRVDRRYQELLAEGWRAEELQPRLLCVCSYRELGRHWGWGTPYNLQGGFSMAGKTTDLQAAWLLAAQARRSPFQRNFWQHRPGEAPNFPQLDSPLLWTGREGWSLNVAHHWKRLTTIVTTSKAILQANYCTGAKLVI